MTDIGFLKTELRQTGLKVQKLNATYMVWFSKKNDFGGLGMVFHFVSFKIHLPTR